MGEENGSITGLYTVLVDGDDMTEPIADSTRSILDGHIVLSRKLAVAGHFPSIDVLESISRVTNAITTPEQRAAATELRKLLAAHREARDLIEIGAYVPGSNPLVDRAIALREVTDLFLRQDMDDTTPVEQSWSVLEQMVAAA
jgi:flagellum-specific ATP synthase